MYEVKIISGTFAGKYVAVESEQDAIREFGNLADMATFRKQQIFRVMVRTTDGDEHYADRYRIEDARADVAENAKAGRAAWWVNV